MTQTADTGKKVTQPELVTLTIDGTEISVPARPSTAALSAFRQFAHLGEARRSAAIRR